MANKPNPYNFPTLEAFIAYLRATHARRSWDVLYHFPNKLAGKYLSEVVELSVLLFRPTCREIQVMIRTRDESYELAVGELADAFRMLVTFGDKLGLPMDLMLEISDEDEKETVEELLEKAGKFYDILVWYGDEQSLQVLSDSDDGPRVRDLFRFNFMRLKLIALMLEVDLLKISADKAAEFEERYSEELSRGNATKR